MTADAGGEVTPSRFYRLCQCHKGLGVLFHVDVKPLERSEQRKENGR